MNDKKLAEIIENADFKVLQRLVAKRRAAEEKRLNALLIQQRDLKFELKKLERQLDKAKDGRGPLSKARKSNARRLNDITLGDAIVKVMERRIKPMHYKELSRQLVERDLYRTRSQNLLSTVAVTLTRDGRFKKTEAGMYALKASARRR
ncbi:MAG: HTH domain-containing protein [Gemmatimonadota bacterium]|jgi:hypothetical protein|nr:HTH domain-containing protein [Gemmatimonadota bacterium]